MPYINYLQEDFAPADLPVMSLSQHLVTQHLGSVLSVRDIGHLEPRLQHTVALHELQEGVADRIASSADSV